MRNNIIATLILSFFSLLSVNAQYTYKQLGTKFLVGKERPYFGSERIQETGPFFWKPTGEKTQFLGDIFPHIGLSGRGLFYNFDPRGLAHICELEGTTEVVRSSAGKIYATACGNLLIFIEPFQKEVVPEKVIVRPPAPAPREDPYIYRAPPVVEHVVVEQPCSCWQKFVRKYHKSNYGNPMWGTDNNYFDYGERTIGFFLFPAGTYPTATRSERWEEVPAYMCRRR